MTYFARVNEALLEYRPPTRPSTVMRSVLVIKMSLSSRLKEAARRINKISAPAGGLAE